MNPVDSLLIQYISLHHSSKPAETSLDEVTAHYEMSCHLVLPVTDGNEYFISLKAIAFQKLCDNNVILPVVNMKRQKTEDEV